jgi:hypothetical protein
MIASGLAATPAPVIDELTSEPISLTPWIGRFRFAGAEYELSGPASRPWNGNATMPPWSVRFLQEMEGGEDTAVFAKATTSVEAVLFLGTQRAE